MTVTTEILCTGYLYTDWEKKHVNKPLLFGEIIQGSTNRIEYRNHDNAMVCSNFF